MTQPPDAPNPTPGSAVPPPGWEAPAPSGWAPPQQSWASPQQAWGNPTPPAGAHPYAPPPKPGVVPLRPLGLGDIFDGSFRTMRRNPAATIGQAVLLQLLVGAITLLAMGPARSMILNPMLVPDEFDTDMLAGMGLWLGISMTLSALLATFAYLLTQLLCTAPTLRALLNLRTPLPLAWALTRGRIGSLLLLALILVGLWTAGLTVWGGGIFLSFQFISGIAATAFGLVGLLVFVVVATFISVRLLFAPAAIAAESLGAVAAMKRSWALTRGSWWRVFGIVLLCSVVVGVAVSVLSTPLSLAGGIVIGFTAPGDTGELGAGAQVIMLLTYAVSYLSAGLGAGYLAVVASLLYSDLRIRREGMDVVLMAEAEAGFTDAIPGNTPVPATAFRSPGYQVPPVPGGGYPPNPAPGYGVPAAPPVPPPWDNRSR